MTNQIPFDFDNPEERNWPNRERYPRNFTLPGHSSPENTIEEVVKLDLEGSEEYLIVTGFTSLSYLIEVFGSQQYRNLAQVRILIGFDVPGRARRKYQEVKLPEEVKEYWIGQGISPFQGGAIIQLVEDLRQGRVLTKFLNRCHAKIFVGGQYAILGSANFSKNGLTRQTEAVIRVHEREELAKDYPNQGIPYRDIQQMAEVFWQQASDYQDQLIELLLGLLNLVSWPEALARAAIEVLDGKHVKEYLQLFEDIQGYALWPTQQWGIVWALDIIKGMDNVLIADPTGSGKTKMASALVLALRKKLYEQGKYNISQLTICPPAVTSNWNLALHEAHMGDHNQLSHGKLSHPSGDKTWGPTLRLANILIIDEAHNYLNPNSKRSKKLSESRAHHTLLCTATPINKRVEDMLRMVELLDVDNLTDEGFKAFKSLKEDMRFGFQRNQDDLLTLKGFIKKFMVRRTKKELKTHIEKDPHLYTDRFGNRCCYPTQIPLTYSIPASPEDKVIAEEIATLCLQLQGIAYLRNIRLPDWLESDAESKQQYLDRRMRLARATSAYQIKACLRSSVTALIEHIEGTTAAITYAQLPEKELKKQGTGNMLQKLRDAKSSLPIIKGYDELKEVVPFNLFFDLPIYQTACEADIKLYQEIATKARKLTKHREQAKVAQLGRVMQENDLALAFDSKVITLHVFKKMLLESGDDVETWVVTAQQKGNREKVMEAFALGSEAKQKLALCSDTMAEGVNLQQAQTVVLLDVPLVMRIVEQRIGRVDRLDSPHKEVNIWWPDDAEEFSLLSDQRFAKLNRAVDTTIGSNVIPPSHLNQEELEVSDDEQFRGATTQEQIQEFQEYVDRADELSQLPNPFTLVSDLVTGDSPLIHPSLYQKMQGIQSEVKVQVSFAPAEEAWGFFAIRGDKHNSPFWVLFDQGPEVAPIREYDQITDRLRVLLKDKSDKVLPWQSTEFREYRHPLKKLELDSLSPKRKRALEVAEKLLRDQAQQAEPTIVALAQQILPMFRPHLEDGWAVDYVRFADMWLAWLMPELTTMREAAKRKRNVFNLNSLILPKTQKSSQLRFSEEQLKYIHDNCPIGKPIEQRIAACIVGIVQPQDNTEHE